MVWCTAYQVAISPASNRPDIRSRHPIRGRMLAAPAKGHFVRDLTKPVRSRGARCMNGSFLDCIAARQAMPPQGVIAASAREILRALPDRARNRPSLHDQKMSA